MKIGAFVLTKSRNFDMISISKENDNVMKKKPKKPYMPRVVVKMNTGTRVMKSKKNKANTRRALNKQTKEMY